MAFIERGYALAMRVERCFRVLLAARCMRQRRLMMGGCASTFGALSITVKKSPWPPLI